MISKLRKWWPEILLILGNIYAQFGPQILGFLQQAVMLHPKWSVAITSAIIFLGRLAPQPQKPTPQPTGIPGVTVQDARPTGSATTHETITIPPKTSQP